MHSHRDAIVGRLKLVTHSMSTDSPSHAAAEALVVRRACRISLGSNVIAVPCTTAARSTSESSSLLYNPAQPGITKSLCR